MEKTRKIRTLNLVALIVAVLGLTIAFAALSKTLTINGTASVDAASWDVHFENVQLAETVGSAKENAAPTLSSDNTKIEGINISLTRPGDKIAYSFDVVNSGTISAKVDVLNNGILFYGKNFFIEDYSESLKSISQTVFPVCDWNGDNETTSEEREKCIDNIKIDVQHFFENEAFDDYVSEDGTSVIIPGNNRISNLILGFYYDQEATELPKGNVTMNIDFSMLFTQE